MMDADVKEIIIRFHGDNFMRSLDANDIVARALAHFPSLSAWCTRRCPTQSEA